MFVVDGLPARIQQAESALETAIDATDADAEAEARKQLAVHTNYRDATAAIVPTPPTMTLAKQMTLTRGGREIQLWFFGRGHTGGDVVVYLPEEKVIVTGDLVTSGISYMGNAYLSEWADTLDAVKELDFDVVLPGHGAAFEGKEKIEHFQAYIRDLWTHIVAKHESGVSADEAAKTIDLSSHAEHFPQIEGPGVHPHASSVATHFSTAPNNSCSSRSRLNAPPGRAPRRPARAHRLLRPEARLPVHPPRVRPRSCRAPMPPVHGHRTFRRRERG